MSAAPPKVDYEHGLRLVRRLAASGRFPMAVRWADRLCQHRPDDPRAHNQAGLIRQRRGRPDEATIHFRRALLLRPDSAEVWTNFGNACRHAAAFAQASAYRRRAYACRPDLPETRLARAFDLLSSGDYRVGFAEYESRPDRELILARYVARGIPAWLGGNPDGLRLLLAIEQGAGDAVQFLRFAKTLADRGATVTVACPPSLERVVASAPGVSATISQLPSAGSTDWDFVDLLMSVPARLGVDVDSVRGPDRYIDPPLAPYRLPDGDGLRVGLCWTGSTLTPLNRLRRIAFSELGPVLAVPGVEFFSLQVLVGQKEMQGDRRLVDLAPHIDDFADTAAMIDQMDLVITVDTSVAHIAGALGKPVWTLLAKVADWRWGYEGDTTPWYSSMLLFRQTRSEEWADVVQRVAAELNLLVADAAAATSRRPFASSRPTG